jgi:uncharacterized membrane protein YfcA
VNVLLILVLELQFLNILWDDYFIYVFGFVILSVLNVLLGVMGGMVLTPLFYMLFCSFSWSYNPFGCIFQSPAAGFSLLILDVS